MEEPIQPTEQTLTACPECDAAVVPDKVFCNKCGFPVNGTKEQKSDFNKFKLKMQLDIANKHVKNGSITLYVLSGLIFVGTFFIATVMENYDVKAKFGAEKTPFVIVLAILGAIYLALGLFTKKKPFAAQLTALIVYCTLLILGMVADPSVKTILGGILWKVLIIVALVRGTKGGYEADKIRKELKID